MATDTTKQTEATLAHHFQALGQGIDAILMDYTEDSILFTPNGPVRGLAGLRAFFAAFFNDIPPGFMAAFQMVRLDIDGEIGYFLWKAEPFAPLGTDTFVVRQGKILRQTYAAHMPS
ncbi:MAG: nuclear transport factor 2 family protein [Chloroflexi bacterium]|nr:nuclear transport factor 2 family protein [Chloroflexota bacterium]